MLKPILLILLLFYCTEEYAQTGFIVLKKRGKSIQRFGKESHITFQMQDRQWITGIITRIAPDSFYFTREIIRYHLMGSDTLHFSGLSFALKDVYALPTKKELIVFDQDRVKVVLGHEKFVWIRNGFLFRVAGAGYTGLNIANNLINNKPPFAKKNLPALGVGAAVYLVGELLHLKFDPYLHIGKKYRLECIFFNK